MPSRTGDVNAWLRSRPPLEQLQQRWPEEWERVSNQIGELTARGDVEELKAYVAEVAGPAATPIGTREARLRAEVRRQMTVAALKQVCLSMATGVKEGRVRFNLINGWAGQKLLFREGLERKPASMFWFRLIWPLLWQRRLLMPLVNPKGIYCFYSDRLVQELAGLIGDRSCLEIAAGDGTLSRFLADAGVDITATDDHSWKHVVRFPAAVKREDARTALRRRRPQVVICSWPPAGNEFERDVFATRSVELYIVIGSRHEYASGNWAAYRAQERFEFAEDPRLSRLVLPPEVESQVLVFRRIEGADL
jgi:hypothetical protein